MLKFPMLRDEAFLCFAIEGGQVRVFCVALLTLLLEGVAASAHHSPAMFDMARQIELKGAVREFQWTNPHSYIQLVVKDEKGKEVEWSLEMGAPTYLYNSGWRPSTVKAGQALTVTIFPLKSGAHGGLVLNVVTPDGRKLGGSGGKP